MATELEELIGFLSSPSPLVKEAAVDIALGLASSGDGLQTLASYADTLLPPLSHLLGENKKVSVPAAQTVTNLSYDPDVSEKMISMGMIDIAMENLYKQHSEVAKLLVMLLVNLTRSEAGREAMLQIGDDKMHGLYVMKLARSFCTSSNDVKGDFFEANGSVMILSHVAGRSSRRSSNDIKGDAFEAAGSILVNISAHEAGRKLLLDPKRGLLKQILRQYNSTSPMRKMGVVSTIRNCCFDSDTQLQNILLASEFLWPALLLPVAGKKIYSEQDTSKMPLELGSALRIEREPVDHPDLRIQALDAIYMIALEEGGRRALGSVNGPQILQVGYEDEENPNIMEAYQKVFALLVEGTDMEDTSTKAS